MGIFGSLLKTTLDIATSPIDIAKDVLTLGGTITDENEPYTVQKMKRLNRDIEDIIDDVDDL